MYLFIPPSTGRIQHCPLPRKIKMVDTRPTGYQGPLDPRRILLHLPSEDQMLMRGENQERHHQKHLCEDDEDLQRDTF